MVHLWHFMFSDLKAEITYKIETSQYCPIPQEVCSSNRRSMLEFCESGRRIYINQGVVFNIHSSSDCPYILFLGVHALYIYKESVCFV